MKCRYSPIFADYKVKFSGEGEGNLNIPAVKARYISSIANFKSLDFAEYPILQVVSIKMYSDEEISSNNKKSAMIHFTHLRLLMVAKM